MSEIPVTWFHVRPPHPAPVSATHVILSAEAYEEIRPKMPMASRCRHVIDMVTDRCLLCGEVRHP